MACGCGASCVQLQLSASVLWLAFTPHVMLWVHFVCRWTSLVVAAEVFRYVATQSPAAAANVWQYFNGMRTLNDITGIKVRLHCGPPCAWMFCTSLHRVTVLLSWCAFC